MKGRCPAPCSHTAPYHTLKQRLSVELHRAHGTSGRVLKQGDRAEHHTGEVVRGQHPARKVRREAARVKLWDCVRSFSSSKAVFQGLTFSILRGGQDKSSAKKAAVLPRTRVRNTTREILSTSELLLLLQELLLAEDREGSFGNPLPREQPRLALNLPLTGLLGKVTFPC